MNKGSTIVLVVSAGILLGGCGPSKANIELRKKNQELQAKVARLEKQREGDLARLRGFEQAKPSAAIPQKEIDRLFTVHGLSFGKLTGGYKEDDRAEQDAGVAVHIVPTDQEGQTLKAAGAFTVSLLDLKTPEQALLGKRTFSLEEAKKSWYGQALLFNYVLKVPFQSRPTAREVMVSVEFVDELTGRVITAQKNVTVNP